MNIYELISQRQSDRKYDPNRPVPREILDRIVEAGRLAPSACNAQPWHFIIIDEPSVRKEVATALTSGVTGSMNHFAQNAPALIVIVEEKPNLSSRLGGIIMGSHFAHIDIGITAAYMTLAATHEGVGSCLIGWINERKLRKQLNIPSNKRIPLVLTLGYSLEASKRRVRKEIHQVRSYNKY